ncbi:hypothetical protein K449DRAFT_433847 [Hypoxylon sp. EC38]|nr:hypothetical protein K449DRAFT_433847 [Hypoxylon sp. EC38]
MLQGNAAALELMELIKLQKESSSDPDATSLQIPSISLMKYCMIHFLAIAFALVIRFISLAEEEQYLV